MQVDQALRIMIVDDDRTTLRLLRALLYKIKFRDVEDATDGLRALEKLHDGHFDLIISDWHMQPMDGLDLLYHVRGNSLLAKVPFIMVTAECAPDRIAEAKLAGVTGYIVKPFGAATLIEQIRIAFQ